MRAMNRGTLPCSLATVLLLAACGAAAAGPLQLHVKSPDWRDQVIYFVMTDRFDDGDPRNNDQGVGAYDPARGDRFNGGDLRGITRRLDYIRGLGATALWLTPPVRNQWVDGALGHVGYHGYWAQHFKQVDPHLGTLADYRRLSHALHTRGMVLVQDIVVNHVGNYFDYGAGWDANDPGRQYLPNRASKPTGAPTQVPFNLNDPRRAPDRRAAVYHWTPALVDTQVRAHELNHQMSSLDDLNTESPGVRRALRDSFGWWIRNVGVDAFRVDTAFYVPPAFFDDFMHSKDARAAGIVEAARRTGRRDFLVFGEGFGIDRAGEDTQARRIESYVTSQDPSTRGKPLMSGMLNFPLYGALVDVFARGRPTAELADRVQRMQAVHRDVHRMPSFIDNHDVDRWLAGGSEAGMKQALLALMTLPGIPVLYYGTEQGFVEQRAAMFAGGFASGGRDRFDTAAPLYRATAAATALRRLNPLFSRGLPVMLRTSDSGPGVLAWRTAHEGQAALVVFNTAAYEVLVDRLDTGAAAGAVLEPLFGLHGLPARQVVGAGGTLNLRVPAQGGLVWKLTPAGPTPAPAAPSPALSLDEPNVDLIRSATADFDVTGRAPAGRSVRVVVDGDITRAATATADATGRFAARIDTRRMTEPGQPHRVVAWLPDSTRPDDAAQAGITSEAHRFTATLPWRVLAEVTDPQGDDLGPRGSYQYPTHSSFARGQMDLRAVRVLGAGGALRIEVDTQALSSVWGPPNGFDHVAFTLFVELPGRTGQGEGADGARVMPGQNAELPDGMRWHLRLRAHGWSNALFGPAGATASADGTALTPGAMVSVDADARRIRFTLPSAALGDPASLSGARVFITTWDYDGGYRALAAEPAPFTMGGGDAARDPKVMDAVGPIRLP